MIDGGRPGDFRGFVHKRILGGIGGFLEGGPLGALRGFARGGGQSREQQNAELARRAAERAQQRQRVVPFVAQPPAPFTPRQPVVPGLPEVGFGDVTRRFKPITCPPGFILVNGQCTATNGGGAPPPIQPLPPGAAEGQAIVGRFGAGILPDTFEQRMTRCPRGMVLGVDVICYNRRDIRNSDRMWPRGRRPLLTGGDMRCISVAARAATKLKGKQKQLEELGLLKKPAPRRRPALPAAHHAHVAHDGA